MQGFFSFIKSMKGKFFSFQIPLEKRITYAMVIFATAGEIFGFIESLLLGLPLPAILLPFFSIIFLMALSVWGFQTKNTNLFAMLAIGICSLIIFPLMFFVNSGLDGGMEFYLMLTIVTIALALRGWTRLIFFAIALVENVGLFIIHRQIPEIFIIFTEDDAFIDKVCSMAISCVVLFFFSYTVSKQNAHDREKIKYLSDLYEKQANTDELTGLFNRRYFNNFLKLAIATLADSGSLHLAMFDIDDFKHVNDKYGHPFGDVVLKKFAAILQEREKLGATACRYGGEEFLLLIPKKSRDEAVEIVKEILSDTRTTIEIEKNRCVTVSAGFLTCGENLSFEETMQEVDKKLYEAKKSGKDRIVS